MDAVNPPISQTYLVGILTGQYAAASHVHITGDITGLDSALAGKQATLVSGTNIKTVNSTSLLGSGDIAVGGSFATLTGVTTDNANLTSALNAKLSLSGGTMTGTLVVPGSGQIDTPGTGITRHFGSTNVWIQANSGSISMISAGATTLTLNAGVSTFENATSFDSNATIIVNGRGTQLADLLELDTAGTSTGNAMRVMNGATEVAKWTKTGAITQGVASGSSDPTTSDFAASKGGWYRNTTSGEIRWWYNDAGTMKKSAALTT
jgi:hypothetical protein